MENFAKLFDINTILDSAEKNAAVFVSAIPQDAVKKSVTKLVDAQFELIRTGATVAETVLAETRKAVETYTATK